MKVDEGYIHMNVCREALTNDQIFNNFKSIPEYRAILEHVAYEHGIEYLQKILMNDECEDFNWNTLLTNDNIGNPQIFNYENVFIKSGRNIKLSNYIISPTTLRYISTGIDMLKYIKSFRLETIDIVEVGGGYGGQCKIMYDLCKHFGISIRCYDIIDIPVVSEFQKKYLNSLGYGSVDDINFKNFNNLTPKLYDLLISNYGISEFDAEFQEFYVENVLKASLHYYMIWNTPNIPEYLKNSEVIDEIPLTAPGNKILIG